MPVSSGSLVTNYLCNFYNPLLSLLVSHLWNNCGRFLSCLHLFLAVLSLCCWVGATLRRGTRTSHCNSFSSGTRANWVAHELTAPRHVGSSWISDWTCVPCIGRWVLIHCATREVPMEVFFCTAVLKEDSTLSNHNWGLIWTKLRLALRMWKAEMSEQVLVSNVLQAFQSEVK